jgi:hypothetical protein
MTPTLTEHDLEMFARIGVPSDLLEAAQVERVSDRDARERFGIQGPPSRNMAGIVFPYLSHLSGNRVTSRVRRDNPEIEGGKPKNKYISAYGDGRHLYFPPNAAEKLGRPDMPIVLLEAEKSALALTAWVSREGMDLLPVAMGGCWGWRGRVGKAESADGSRVDVLGVLPDLSVCDQRRVIVLLDSNVAGNAKVRQAEKALAIYLAERGCDVQIRHLPQIDGVNGPDDLLAIQGDDALRMALTTTICPSDGPGILEAAMDGIEGKVYSSNMERFYALCVVLQRLRGQQAVALPVERIAKLLGCHWSSIANYRRQAVMAGWLQRVGQDIPHIRAATFSVNLPNLALSENSLHTPSENLSASPSENSEKPFSESILTNSESILTKNRTKHMGEDYSSSTYSENALSEKTTTPPSESADSPAGGSATVPPVEVVSGSNYLEGAL